MALPPNYLFVNPKDGRLVSKSYIQVPGGSASEPSISFIPSPDSGLSCDSTGKVSIIANGNQNLIVDSSSVSLGVPISYPLGTAAAPSITFTGDPNTGIYSPGADQLAISTNGTGRLFVDATGRVGVGTTSPTAPLTVNGVGVTARFQSGAASDGRVEFAYNTTDVGYISASDASTFSLWARSGNALSLGAGNQERARIDSSGRLLVGTASSLDINSSLQVVNNSGYPVELFTSRNDSYGPDLTLVKSRGSTASPTVVSSGDQVGQIVFKGYSGAAAAYVEAARIEGYVDGTPDSGGDTTDMPGRLVFSVTADGSASPTEAMRINNAGELLVGYTTDNGAYKLQVNSQIFATSATIATSDGRYKENVATLDGCVDLVKALRPVSFDWKPQQDITRIDDEGNQVLVREGHNFPDGKQVGFIAQEVQEVLADKPWLGSVIKQNVRPAVKDNDGKELAPEEEFFGIAEGNLVAVLTSALKDAIGRIETLEAEVAALKS